MILCPRCGAPSDPAYPACVHCSALLRVDDPPTPAASRQPVTPPTATATTPAFAPPASSTPPTPTVTTLPPAANPYATAAHPYTAPAPAAHPYAAAPSAVNPNALPDPHPYTPPTPAANPYAQHTFSAWHVTVPVHQAPNAPEPLPPTTLQPPVAGTWLTVIVPIVLGGIYQLVFWTLGRHDFAPNAMGRYVLAGTVALYAIVGLIVLGWLGSTRRRLVWYRGSSPVVGAILGVTLGCAGGLLGVLVQSAAAGHLSSDPSLITLASEGDTAHVLSTLLLVAVAAPLVEETLFRGIFLEWLRPKGIRIALLVSALAFAVWHYRLGEWRYYTLMGVLLGLLYWKRGLVASMSAHAAFNGTLALVAISIALTPAAPAHLGNLAYVKPQGWHAVKTKTDAGLALYQGPSGAVLAVNVTPTPSPVPVSILATHMNDVLAGLLARTLPGAQVDAAQAGLVSYPIGEVLQVPVRMQGSDGDIAIVDDSSDIDVILFLDAGSAKARAGFHQFMTSLQSTA